MLILFDLGCIAFFFALLLTPLVREVAKKTGATDQPDSQRKIHVRPIPRLGGISVALAYVLALGFILIAPYQNPDFDVGRGLQSALSLLPAASIIFLTGIIDDLRSLKPWQKLAGQTIGAVLAYLGGFGIHVFQGQSLEMWLSLPLSVVWLVGCTNALNLVDGMDGLGAGVGFFAALTTLVAALIHQSTDLALVTAPLVGSLLGFLRYNFNPASIFLGDSGSLLVGFLLGCFGALWSQKSATLLGMTAPLMALAFPLLEVGLSVIRRFLRSRPIFAADRGHIHHRLLEQGLTPRRAALVLYAVCGLAAAFSLLQEVVHNRFGGLIIVLFCAAAWIGVQHLGYAEFGLAGRLILRGTLRGIIDVQLRLQRFERALNAARSLEDAWEVILDGCREFGFQGGRLSVQGRIFEERDYLANRNPAWQVRIPLPDSQYVNFYRPFDANMHPIVLTAFAQAVERALKSKLADHGADVLSDRLGGDRETEVGIGQSARLR